MKPLLLKTTSLPSGYAAISKGIKFVVRSHHFVGLDGVMKLRCRAYLGDVANRNKIIKISRGPQHSATLSWNTAYRGKSVGRV